MTLGPELQIFPHPSSDIDLIIDHKLSSRIFIVNLKCNNNSSIRMPVGVFGSVTTLKWYSSIIHVFESPNGLNSEVKVPATLREIFRIEDFLYLMTFSSTLYDPNQEK